MKKKLTTFMFGLLLAVGWTNTAQAQLKVLGSTKPVSFNALGQQGSYEKIPAVNAYEAVPNANNAMFKGVMPQSRAPRRADYTEVANAVHPKSWYDQYVYYWYDENGEQQSKPFTEPATNKYQMFYLTRTIYMEDLFPGIKYSKPKGKDHEYLGCDFGWWVSGDISEDITIDMTAYVNIDYIGIYDFAGNRLAYYDANETQSTTLSLPQGWTASSYLQKTYSGTSYNRTYYLAWNSYGNTNAGYNPTTAITISKNSTALQGKGGLQVLVEARRTRANPSGFSKSNGTTNAHYCYVVNYGNYGEEKTLTATSTWEQYVSIINYPVTPPQENGYTVMLVKLKDKDANGNIINNNTSVRAPMYTVATSDKTSTEVLMDYFDTYVDEIQLLTDGLRVGQNVDGQLVDGGTLFSYSGTLNRFFFISKGKMAYISGSENEWAWSQTSSGYYNYSRSNGDRAPFYNMYEEFSPTEQDNTTGIDDFYAKMVAGETYHIKHDCNSVCYMQHYFSMSGKDGSDPKSVSNLVFYIPDYRGTDSTGVAWRNYDINNQPRVGLYTIRLQADAQRAADYNKENPEYTVTVTWQSNLASIVDNQVPQTYELYEVVYDENGNIVERKLLTTTQNITSYTYNVPQRNESYTITYQVKGYPTNATNKDSFFAWSNFDDVVIPGLFDFLLLKRDHYESDFVISQLKNYYRNYIYPTNLAPNTGMTIEQLKQDWPEDQIAKYTLYRDHTGIAQLWVRAIGKKVYYKITYIPETQDTTGPNNININNTNN